MPYCCGGACVDLSNDVLNCGGCGQTCGQETQGCCNAICDDVYEDTNNCGTCGDVCTGLVDPYCCSGSCVDVSADDQHCSACTIFCNVPSAYCAGDECHSN
jgi:hypothetical protein